MSKYQHAQNANMSKASGYKQLHLFTVIYNISPFAKTNKSIKTKCSQKAQRKLSHACGMTSAGGRGKAAKLFGGFGTRHQPDHQNPDCNVGKNENELVRFCNGLGRHPTLGISKHFGTVGRLESQNAFSQRFRVCEAECVLCGNAGSQTPGSMPSQPML